MFNSLYILKINTILKINLAIYCKKYLYLVIVLECMRCSVKDLENEK